VLCRLHSYTHDVAYRDRAEQTLELLAAVAGRYGIFAGAYGVAAVHLASAATQVVIVGEGELAEQLHEAAITGYAINRSIVRLSRQDASATSLPPALAETIPNLPGLAASAAVALVCTGFACQPPTSDPEALRNIL